MSEIHSSLPETSAGKRGAGSMEAPRTFTGAADREVVFAALCAIYPATISKISEKLAEWSRQLPEDRIMSRLRSLERGGFAFQILGRWEPTPPALAADFKDGRLPRRMPGLGEPELRAAILGRTVSICVWRPNGSTMRLRPTTDRLELDVSWLPGLVPALTQLLAEVRSQGLIGSAAA